MAQKLTEKLILLGCRCIGVIRPEPGPMLLFTDNRRVQGYRLALLSHGLAYDAALDAATDVTCAGGFDAMNRLLRTAPDLYGVVYICDPLARGAMLALEQAGKARKEVQLASTDKTDLWSLCDPPICCADFHPEELG